MKKLELLLIIIFLSFHISWGQETPIYTTGFESSEGFTASTSYNNTTVLFTGPSGQQWGTYYGTPSTTSPITGSQSMQMRWYTSSPANLGYTFTNFDLANVTKVTFKSKNYLKTNGVNVIVSYSTDGGTSYTEDSTFTLTTTPTDYEYIVSTTGEYPSVRIKFGITYTTAPTATDRLLIDDVVVYGMTSSSPNIVVNPTSLSGFTYVEGSGPSISQSYTLSGSNLDPADGNITVTGSTNYEVSTDNSTFSGTLDVTYTGGVLSDTTIYVRLKAGLTVGDYNGEIITNSGGSATQQDVTVTGSVTPLTTLTVTPITLSGFYYIIGNGPSTSKSYTLSGSNLDPADGNITVAGSTNYEVSIDNTTFNDTLQIAYSGSSLSDTTIYVRLMAGLDAGTYNNETISNFGGGAANKNVTVNGSVASFFPIDSLKMNDSVGIPVKLTDTVSTSGIVTSILQLGTGNSGPGTIQNANTAISIYSSFFTSTPGLQIGDSVIVSNFKVSQYKGLTELTSITSSAVNIISSGHKVKPLVVKISDIKNQAWNGFEKYEGMLVRINKVQFVQTDSFTIGTALGANFQFFDATDTLDIRILKTNSSLKNKPIPTGLVDIVGIVQQFDDTTPYNSGYQILPLDSSGIISRLITPIDSLKENNANGISQMLNDTVNTTGIVTSIKQLGTGNSGPGTIQNANTAVSIYGNTFTGTPGLQIGDSVVVYDWKVVNHNGLTELSYIASSSVQIISSGHIITPLLVTIPEIKNQPWNGFEKYEGMLLQINDVHFVQTGTFEVGNASGVNYKITNDTDTLDLRIVKTNLSLIGKPIPTGNLNIVGILQQYKTSAPYNSGYQILPLDSSGINIINAIEDNQNNLVNAYQLSQNYPNPFNPSTTIRFNLPVAGNVRLTVFNILGQEVKTLVNGYREAGQNTVTFEAKNLSSGIYIYKIEAGSFTQTKKMTLLK